MKGILSSSIGLRGEQKVADAFRKNIELLKHSRMPSNEIVHPNFHRRAWVEPVDSRGLSVLERKVNALDDAIQYRNSDAARISDCTSEEVAKFLKNIVEVQELAHDFKARKPRIEGVGEDGGLLHRANIVLQNAMLRLEEDFVYLLVRYGKFVEPNDMSFRSENGLPDDFSINSIDPETMQERLQRNETFDPEEYSIRLLNPDVLSDIKRIATFMFKLNYGVECCQSYITIRKDALDECLTCFWTEKLSITDVLKMKWEHLDRKIGRWIKVMKVFIRVYLASEKRLCNEIFANLSQSGSRDCFFESAKGSIMHLINFAEGVALGTPIIEKLFRVLNVYNTLRDLLPDMESLNLKDSGFCMMSECREILYRLSELASVILRVFKDKIQNEPTLPSDKGELHPLTRYVMNYVQLIAEYENSISSIFGSLNSDNMVNANSNNTFSLAEYIASALSILEINLDGKSLSYTNISLRHLFLMNNIQYMVRKVRDVPELESLLGDGWLKDYMVKYRKHVKMYERTTWAPVIAFLAVEDNPHHNSANRKMIKEKFKRFNHAFEEVYKVQTAWIIPNMDLRDELRVSISCKLVAAYRTCFGLYGTSLEGIRHRERYLKYTPEDLHDYLYDLFEGSSKSLPSHH